MSVLGVVEVVKGHRARVRTSGGDLVYVVATKERPVAPQKAVGG
jgi:hypothetical protein